MIDRDFQTFVIPVRVRVNSDQTGRHLGIGYVGGWNREGPPVFSVVNLGLV